MAWRTAGNVGRGGGPLILFFPPCCFKPAILEESVGDHRHERMTLVIIVDGDELALRDIAEVGALIEVECRGELGQEVTSASFAASSSAGPAASTRLSTIAAAWASAYSRSRALTLAMAASNSPARLAWASTVSMMPCLRASSLRVRK
jgi:hypothetical protein